MKAYKSTKKFSSPTLGNVEIGARVIINEVAGAKMVEAGFVSPIEDPKPVLEVKAEPKITPKIESKKRR